VDPHSNSVDKSPTTIPRSYSTNDEGALTSSSGVFRNGVVVLRSDILGYNLPDGAMLPNPAMEIDGL
jgi:hypothetical protein